MERFESAVRVTTSKVGDTLTAEVVDLEGKDASDNVTFQWYLDDEELDGETDETLYVTVGMIGSTIKVVVTAENGNTFESEETDPVKDVNLGVIEIESAKATKANEVTVTLANPVISSEVEISLAKGTNEISVDEKWNDTLVPVTTALSSYGNLKEALAANAITGENADITITGVSNKGVTVTGQYNGQTITVPKEFYTGIDSTDYTLRVNNDSKVDVTTTTASAIAVNKLYSTTEYTRKTADLSIAVNISTIDTQTAANGTPDTVNVNKVSSSVSVQDGAPTATTIKFYGNDGNEITEGIFNATDLKYTIDGTTNNLLRITGKSVSDFIQANPWKNVYYAVYDQYGDRIEVPNETFKVTDIENNDGGLAHVSLNSFSVTANQTAAVTVDYAELGDTFNLTVSNGGASATIAITQGADDLAYLGTDVDTDKPFRKGSLGYDR